MEELRQLKSNSHICCWCLVGDFNCVKGACERVGVGGEDVGVGESEELNDFFMRWEWRTCLW